MTSATGIRARNRAAIEAAILDTARDHLRTQGADALSLRAVARDLQMTSSAIYRYVDSRDELLTRLIIASYTSLADAVESAVAQSHRPVDRWIGFATAMRAWAVQHPHEWALIYGSPVPDYQAPAERTTQAGTRVMTLVLDILQTSPQLCAQGSVPRAARAAARRLLAGPLVAGRDITPAALLAGLDAWTLVVGAISREVFGQFGELPDPAALFAATARRSAHIALPGPPE